MEKEERLVYPNISHIGYIVGCIEDNTAAFRELFGVEEFNIYEFKPVRAWAYGKEIYDCHFTIAMGIAQNGMGIELIQPVSGSTPQMDFLEQHGGGMHHFSMSVKDFNAWKTHIKCIQNANIIFEAEVYDEKRGYRRCIYVQSGEICPVFEFAEIPRK